MRKTIIVSLFSFFVTVSFSQSVGIGTSTPDSSAQLDVFSNNKGFLPPRVALVSLDVPDPISKPAAGLLVYNTGTAGTSPNNVFPGYYYWNGLGWSKISQDISHQLNGTIKIFSNPLYSARTTFIVPPGKVWKLNYVGGGTSLIAIGNVSVPYVTADLDNYDILLNQNDSFSVASSYFISISEYSASSKSVKTFNDSLPGNTAKSFIVPANKIWKLNFFLYPIGNGGLSVGNPGIPILIPNLYNDVKSNANIFLPPNTEIRVTNIDTETSKYFFSVSEFDE